MCGLSLYERSDTVRALHALAGNKTRTNTDWPNEMETVPSALVVTTPAEGTVCILNQQQEFPWSMKCHWLYLKYYMVDVADLDLANVQHSGNSGNCVDTTSNVAQSRYGPPLQGIS